MEESILVNPPSDGISCLNFSPLQTEMLLVSSWDATVRLYDACLNKHQMTINFNSACLACCFDDAGSIGFSGGLDSSVYLIDLARGIKMSLGSHSKAISCMQFNSYSNSLFTGSWDSSVISWDIRSPNFCKSTLVKNQNKVYSLSSIENQLVVATSDRKVLIYDVRNLSSPEQVRESPLRHQTRKVACNPDGQSFAISSTEGRVAIEYFDQNPEIQMKKYAFKCHRKNDRAYPVNSIAFHPTYGTFATGGCDGMVSIWDGANKKRLSQLHPFPSSISSLAFSNNGNFLAIASSYTFEEGEKIDKLQDNIHIKRVDTNEVKPRQKN